MSEEFVGFGELPEKQQAVTSPIQPVVIFANYTKEDLKIEWIKVEDELPKDYDAYLCTGGDIEMEIVYFDPEFGWSDEYGITHWMNLPELP